MTAGAVPPTLLSTFTGDVTTRAPHPDQGDAVEPGTSITTGGGEMMAALITITRRRLAARQNPDGVLPIVRINSEAVPAAIGPSSMIRSSMPRSS